MPFWRMSSITLFLLLTQVVLLIQSHLVSASRLCCDPDCKTPISYGKTRTRSLSGEKGHLSYPANAKVTVYSKGRRDADGVELLEAEISGRKGLIPKDNVIEIATLCSPTHMVYSEAKPVDETAPSSNLDLPSSDVGYFEGSSAEPNTATTSVEAGEQISSAGSPDSSGKDYPSSEENTNYDSKHGLDASHDLNSLTSGVVTPDAHSAAKSDSTSVLTAGSQDPIPSPAEPHPFGQNHVPEHVVKWMEEQHTIHEALNHSTQPHSSPDVTDPSTLSSTPTDTTDHSIQSHVPSDHSTSTDTTDNSTPTDTTDHSTPHDTTDHSTHPDAIDHSTPSDTTGDTAGRHSIPPDTTGHSAPLDTTDHSHTHPTTTEQWHDKREGEIKKEAPLLPNGTHSVIVMTSPLIDLGQGVGLSPDSPIKEEELDGTPLSLLKLYDTPVQHSQHVEPSHDSPLQHSQHVEPSHDSPLQHSPYVEPSHDSPLQHSPYVEPSPVHISAAPSINSLDVSPLEDNTLKDSGQTLEDNQISDDRRNDQVSGVRDDVNSAAKNSMEHTESDKDISKGPIHEEKQFERQRDFLRRRNDRGGFSDGSITYHEAIQHGAGDEESAHISEHRLSEPQTTPSATLSEDQLQTSPHITADQQEKEYFTHIQGWYASLQQVELGLMSVIGTVLAMVLPLFIFWCQARKQNAQRSGQLKAHEMFQGKLEEQLQTAKHEKEQVMTELRSAQAKCQHAESKHVKLQDEKLQLECQLQSVTDSHTAILQELALCQAQLENLKIQFEVMKQEKELAQHQLKETTAQVQQLAQQAQELVSHVQELEATKDQLEQDVYTSQQSLEQMQDWGAKINVEYEATQTRCLSLESELNKANSDLTKLQGIVKDKDEEIAGLRQCLQQVVDKEQQTDGEAPLARIQAMLDTTKAQVELRKALEEKENLTNDLQKQLAIVVQLKDSCKDLQDKVTSLLEERDEAHRKHQETQVKLKGLTEYFEQKEHALHTKLGAQEVEKMVVRSKQQEALEKATAAEQERERERVELTELRKQMAEIEKSHAQQVMTNEKRVEDALCQLRKTEEELRQANRKITSLQKQLSEAEHQLGHSVPYEAIRPRPPSAGPHSSGVGGSSAPPPGAVVTTLPPSSQPRTSSPSSSGRPDAAELAHNTSYPGAGTRNMPLPNQSIDRKQMSDDRPPPMVSLRPMPLPPPWMRRPPLRRPMVHRPYYPFPPDPLAAVPPPGGFMGPAVERPEMTRPPSSGSEMTRPPSSGPERVGFQPIGGRPAPPMGSVPQNIPLPYFGGNSFTQP